MGIDYEILRGIKEVSHGSKSSIERQGTFYSRRYGRYKGSQSIVLLSMAFRTSITISTCVQSYNTFEMASTYNFVFPPDTPLKRRT